MKQWTRVRHKVLRDKQSKRSVMREEGLHWETLGKMLAYSQPPGYRRKKRRERKIDPYVGWIEEVLKADRNVPKKQRHTAKRIYQRLGREKGYQGGYTAVKEVVAELRARRREVFVPLEHRPGEGQVDFGHALVKEAGQLRRRPFFAMSLPYSDAFFVQVFERECTESFWEGHLRAFEFFGAVPRRISYDNSKVAVGKIIGSRERKLTDGFLQLQSHYLFEEHFCLPARPNEKGVVEGIVRYARANFLVPVPQVRDLEELNAKLLEACERDMERKLRGKRAVKKELLAEERAVMLALPPIPFEASRKRSTCVSSLSLVRFECNDYSVPVRCAHHPVVVEGSCRQVVIFCGGQEVARHPSVGAKRWPGTAAFGIKSKSLSSRCTTWLCWRKNRALWTSPAHSRAGSCRSACRSSDAGSKANAGAKAPGSISGCCGCWRNTPWRPCSRPSSRPCGWGD